MVLQVLADAGAVGDDRDAVFRQMRGGSDTRQHQQLGRVEGGGGEDHLAFRPDGFDAAAARDFHADRAPLLDHDAAGEGADQIAIRSFQSRFQVGVRRRPTPAFPHGHVERSKAFLLLTVVVAGDRIARLAPGLDEGAGEGVAPAAAGHVKGTAPAAPRGIAAVPPVVPVLQPLVVGQDVGIAPAVRAHLGPGVEVAGVAAHVDHAVDGGRPADHLAARGDKDPSAQVRLRLGLQAPVVAAHVHRIGQRARHLDEGARVGAAVLDHQNGVIGFR